jgi:hypothetical protein
VALPALRLSGEQGLASPRITRQRKGGAAALQVAKMVDHSFDPGVAEGTECRHSGTWNSSPNNLRKRVVGQLLDFAAAGNVRAALRALSIQTVASGAACGKNLLTFALVVLLRRRKHAQSAQNQHPSPR